MQDQETLTTERNYIAFISYRHKPLDMAVAKKLHRRIERYVIPKELRKRAAGNPAQSEAVSRESAGAGTADVQAGAASPQGTQGTGAGLPQSTAAAQTAVPRKLGLVFRDQDELPIANNLSDNIRCALDHSRFLIVVCSPDTPGSLWVQREIEYFLEHHDRDHLLAVLIDGAPEQSFPPQLTEIRDKDGNLIDRIEPLAANIVADSAHKRNRLFQTESLRILASLIGCPYDALYHREQRYQMRRLGIAAAAAALVAAGFIGMLLNRNARIHEQLLQSMINESTALSALSESALRDGDYRGALEHALNALPGRNPERPYVAEAEKALSSGLYLYQDQKSLRYIQSFEQDTEIRAIALSKDGSRIATGDRYGNVRVSDMGSGQLLWSAKTPDSVSALEFVSDVLLANSGGIHYSVFSAEGELLRQEEEESLLYISPENGMCLGYGLASEGMPARITDVATGKVLYDLGAFDSDYYMMEEGAISRDGQLAALLVKYPGEEKGVDLYLCDLKTGERKLIDKGLMYAFAMSSYDLDFDAEGNLALTFCGLDNLLREREEWKGSYVRLYDRAAGWSPRFTTYLDFGTAERRANGGIDLSDYMDFMECTEEGIVMASRNRLIMADSADGKILWQKDLPERVRDAHVYRGKGIMSLALGDGMLTLCVLSNGALSYDSYMAYFDCSYNLYGAVTIGTSLKDTLFAVIPSEAHNRTAVVSFCPGDELQALSWAEKIPENAWFFPSPSGNAVAAVSRGEMNEEYHLFYQDLSVETGPEEISVSMEDYYNFSEYLDRAAVTDTGKLIWCGRVYDFKDGSEKGLTKSGSLPEKSESSHCVSCTNGQNGTVLTASLEQNPGEKTYSLLLWEDGEYTGKSSVVPVRHLPGTRYDSGGFEKCILRAISPGGFVITCAKENYAGDSQYALYDIAQDKWTAMEYMSTGDDDVLALAESHPWMALQKKDGDLCVIDPASGEEILTMENTLPGDGITLLLFAGEDKWLLAFTEQGALAIFSTADGKELHHSLWSSQNLRFDDGVRCEVHSIPQNDRILLIYDDTTYTESTSIMIDARSMKVTGFYPALSCYFPSDNTVLVNHSNEKACLSGLVTVEGMQEMAEELLK